MEVQIHVPRSTRPTDRFLPALYYIARLSLFSLATLGREKAALTVFVLACVVRLLAVSYLGETDIGIDESEYLVLGQNIRFHGVFSFGASHAWGTKGLLDNAGPFEPTAARAPLYPLLIAVLWWQAAPPFEAIGAIQALLGGGVAVLVYLTARNAFGCRVALIAGIAMAFSPQSSMLTAAILSETLFTFLLMCGLCLWGKQRGLMAGLVLGAATLTRPVLLPFIVLIGVFALICRFNRSLHAWILLGALLVIGPWTLRNAVTQHAFIPVQSLGWGATVLLGTVDVPYGTGQNPWTIYREDADFVRILETRPTEREAERRMLRAGVGRIIDDPLRWLWVRVKQYPRLLVDMDEYISPIVPVSSPVLRGAILAATFLFWLLSLIGIFIARPKWRELYHLALYPAFFLVMHFPLFAASRFTAPMIPVLLIFAALALARIAGVGFGVANARALLGRVRRSRYLHYVVMPSPIGVAGLSAGSSQAASNGFASQCLSPWTMMAQAIRAILLASATAATLVGRRAINRPSHVVRPVVCVSIV